MLLDSLQPTNLVMNLLATNPSTLHRQQLTSRHSITPVDEAFQTHQSIIRTCAVVLCSTVLVMIARTATRDLLTSHATDTVVKDS
jgi:hypothetical protein